MSSRWPLCSATCIVQYTLAFYSYRCPNSMGSDESRIPTLCLVCGEMLCSGSFCCQVEINKPSSPRHNMIGAASAHMQKCGAGSGIFLRYVSPSSHRISPKLLFTHEFFHINQCNLFLYAMSACVRELFENILITLIFVEFLFS